MGFCFHKYDIEHKIHLNLSHSAWLVIDDDIKSFSYGEKYNLAGFLNRVFTNFHLEADASIEERYMERANELSVLFSSKEFKKIDEKTSNLYMDKILNEYRTTLEEKIKQYPKGEGRKVRINKENVSALEESLDSEFYEGAIGAYWKAIFEEYAGKPIYERERIYFKDNVELIESAISQRKKLKLSILKRTDSQGNEEVTRRFYLSPYKIIQDKTRSYNYVVGYSEELLDDGTRAPKRVACYRISRIDHMTIIRSEIAFIKEDDKKAIDDMIAQKEPQFLVGEVLDIKVRFTKRGEESFQRQLYLRPQTYQKVEGEEYTYIFKCTEIQAINYFFKFEREALILSPKSTREKFMEKYRLAYEKYLSFEKDE